MERYINKVQELITGAYDARHVLAIMLIGGPNLAHMSDARFAAEVQIATTCVDLIGPEVAERSARKWKL